MRAFKPTHIVHPKNGPAVPVMILEGHDSAWTREEWAHQDSIDMPIYVRPRMTPNIWYENGRLFDGYVEEI